MLAISKFNPNICVFLLPGHLNLKEVCQKLKNSGMERVMIEGGASVIKSCLSSFDLLDAVVVTIAPTWIGKGITIQNPLSTEVSGF